MKKLVSVTEIEGAGLEALLGENVLLMCAGYFYTGKLTGVNNTFVELSNPAIVYDTGKWSDSKNTLAETLPVDTWYVQVAAIESFGKAVKK